MEKNQSQGDQLLLNIMKPACYGLAAVSFGLILQSYFSEETPIKWQWTLYGLSATIIPLFTWGIFSDIIRLSQKSRPQTTEWMITALQFLLSANIVFLFFCLASIDLIIGLAMSVGAILIIPLVRTIERRVDLDDQKNSTVEVKEDDQD